jgi:hypothetical protein
MSPIRLIFGTFLKSAKTGKKERNRQQSGMDNFPKGNTDGSFQNRDKCAV